LKLFFQATTGFSGNVVLATPVLDASPRKTAHASACFGAGVDADRSAAPTSIELAKLQIVSAKTNRKFRDFRAMVLNLTRRREGAKNGMACLSNDIVVTPLRLGALA
jgi:hypothetical protein